VFPPGGKIGQKVSVKVSGKINQPGTQVWCDNPAVVFEIPEKDNELSITTSADARPGLCWLRFFNAEGATAQMPFRWGFERDHRIETVIVVNLFKDRHWSLRSMPTGDWDSPSTRSCRF